MAKEYINIFRWDQLKHLLQSGKEKVHVSLLIQLFHGEARMGGKYQLVWFCLSTCKPPPRQYSITRHDKLSGTNCGMTSFYMQKRLM
ncbi:hypothetical protein ACET3Z_013419 [Daucus carota]